MYRLATLFQSSIGNSEPTADTTSLKDAAQPPSIAISLSANSKSQIGNSYPTLERHSSASRLSKIWTRFGRRSRDNISAYEGGNTNGEFYDANPSENSVASVGVADKPARKHPFRRHTINFLYGEDGDNSSGAYCTDQVGLLSNASTESGQRSPSMIRSRQFGHRNFLQRKSRPPLISTSSDPSVEWYYKPSTPSPVEVEISVEVVSRPAVLSEISSPEETEPQKQRVPSKTLEEASGPPDEQQDLKEINRFDLAPLDSSIGGIRETLSTRRMNRSRMSLPSITTDPAIILPPPVQSPRARPLNVDMSGESTHGLSCVSNDNSMVARQTRQRKVNSRMQAAVANNSMKRSTIPRSQNWPNKCQNEEDVVPTFRSLMWSDVVLDSPQIPSAPPPSPWAINTTNEGGCSEASPPGFPASQPNLWASMSTMPVSSPTHATVPPLSFGQHIQYHSAAKTAYPSPMGIITRKEPHLGHEALDSPSSLNWPAAPPCTPCTPFPETYMT